MAASKRYRAAVIGGSGYGGAELIRRLLLHPEVELARVASVDHVGEPLAAAHPSLEGATELLFEELAPARAAEGMDAVLLGLPHKVSAHQVPALVASGVRVVDMSGDFRLKDPADYARYYGVEHPHPELLARFVYGLPELNRERLRGARLVAAPGCFATCIELTLLPLARAGLLEGVVHVQGLTGSSGSGVAPSAGTHHPVRAGNLRTYKPLEHQHLPEIAEALAQAGARELALRFVPVSAPLSRGIFATAFVELPDAWDEARLRRLYEEAYAGEPFVRVPRRRLPEVAAVSGSNHAEVGVAVGPAVKGRRTAALFGALDNLVKGGAGQAIQDLNLALGLPEGLSLSDTGPWPP
ncbi:N-acetyl-gamma-glutamyl-phosphate reductase [Anaeromyxobacter diazotrophicus]|uniref:N-acetyl-gamma-glutamyl-phosphate reductase n=1 Tax=Anaeromyxobacter diazotrophicus TaxID=2590199 RepID=A0A7I9VRN7_9BACT|nr:N-acetyl-gamma-glutamyl-phosphate reductase [Anaeromyxobacter diazotrophicus]GEJ58597.1 N-acetyl-gamma-glutamyl-phosphate reductase [Anaeromyxobacter diazotrophicus]